MSEEAVGLCEVLIVGTSPPKELFPLLKADAAVVVDIFELVAKSSNTPQKSAGNDRKKGETDETLGMIRLVISKVSALTMTLLTGTLYMRDSFY